MANSWVNFRLQRMAANKNISKSLKGGTFLTDAVHFDRILRLNCTLLG